MCVCVGERADSFCWIFWGRGVLWGERGEGLDGGCCTLVVYEGGSHGVLWRVFVGLRCTVADHFENIS